VSHGTTSVERGPGAALETMSPAKAPAPVQLEQLERRLAAGYSDAAEHSAGRDIVELHKRVSDLERKRHTEREKLGQSNIEYRIMALENAVSRVSAEAARRAEQTCQKLLAAGSSKTDAAWRGLSTRTDQLAKELETAVATIKQHSAEAEDFATDLDERAEDCAALLQSSAELNNRLSQLEQRHATVDARQERDTIETQQELQQVHQKFAQRSVCVVPQRSCPTCTVTSE
jgi:chromosome segregation ATPase